MRRVTALLAVAVLLLTGCEPETGGSGRRNPGPDYGGYDGASIHPEECRIPEAENLRQPGPARRRGFDDPLLYQRILLVLITDEFRIQDGKEVCYPNRRLPVHVTIAGATQGGPGVKLESGRHLPWSTNGFTPWREWIYVTLKDARSYRVSITGVHNLASGVDLNKEPRTIIRCAIFVGGKRVTASHATVRGPVTTSRCAWEQRL